MRKKSASVAKRNEPIVAQIKAVKAKHPFWGYRRVWAHLRYRMGFKVNHKRIYRLMKEHGLLVPRNLKLKAKRTKTKKPKPIRPNQWWGIDMTKVKTTHAGWVYVVIVVDWFTKKIVGHYVGLQSRAWHWLIALHRAANRQFPDGIKGKKVRLMSDNGCQPTKKSFRKSCIAMGIKQAFTSYGNPKGNADTERMIRTLKEELVWPYEYHGIIDFRTALDTWVADYNRNYLHSTLGYQSPSDFEQQHLTKTQTTPLIAA